MGEPWERALSRDVFNEFCGKGVVIAGVGENNIGAALAEGYHFLGSKVVIIGRDQSHLDAIAERFACKRLYTTFRPHVIAADLTIERARVNAINDACAVGGAPIAFISTVGNDKRLALNELSQEQLRELSLINWEVPTLMGAAMIERMRQNGGVICLFSSHHGAALVDREMMAYGASKAALDNAILRLAHEAAAENTPSRSIRVIGIRPGWVQSQLQVDRFAGAFQDATRSQLIPVEMRPWDLIAPVIGLTSKTFGGLISGVTIPLDAGRSEGPVRNRVFVQKSDNGK